MRVISMDTISLNGIPVVHIIDVQTNFQNTIFIIWKTSHELWSAFVHCWASVYNGLISRTRISREPSCTSREFRENAKDMGLHLKFNGFKAQIGIGKYMKYHSLLSSIFDVTKSKRNKKSDKTILIMSIKESNDTMGPNGLAPSIIVFGILHFFMYIKY